MADSTLILAFDTATPHCSIAITSGGVVNGEILASLSVGSGVTHSRRLLGSIELLMQQVSLSLAEVSGIAVGLGPGSFTGLRIGMSTAKGLVHGADKVLIGVSSLDAIAATINDERLICVLLDARKKEVYGRFYRVHSDGIARPCSEHVVLPPEKIAEQIDEPVVMAGDGVDVYSKVLKEILGKKMAQTDVRYPPAEMVGLLAGEQYRNNSFLDIAAAEPTYVRASDAELSLIRAKR